MARAPIVAIFGSKDCLPLAEALGSEIVEAGGILLTGGNGECDKTVKNQAICGAEKRKGRWVGIYRHSNNDGLRRKPISQHKNHGLILEFCLGHRRNFLEAYMCDVAIALRGNNGTISEVAACAFLDKPVILVGWNLPAELKLGWLIEENYQPRIAELDNKLADFTKRSSCAASQASCQTPAKELVKRAFTAVDTKRSGTFPNFIGAPFQRLREEFEAFIK